MKMDCYSSNSHRIQLVERRRKQSRSIKKNRKYQYKQGMCHIDLIYCPFNVATAKPQNDYRLVQLNLASRCHLQIFH